MDGELLALTTVVRGLWFRKRIVSVLLLLRGHMVNIVTIRGRQYLVDVGFGSNGSHQPFLLEHGIESSNYGGQSIRLVFEPIAQNLNQSQRLWQYECRNAPSESWIPMYCFTETEFLPDDFVILNHFTSTSRESFFTFHLVCVKMLLDPDREEIIGDLTLFNNQLKRRIGAKSEVLATFASDNERVAGLEKYFGVILDKSEREGIHRTITEIL
jgi:arylamine N-acetyltransferase